MLNRNHNAAHQSSRLAALQAHSQSNKLRRTINDKETPVIKDLITGGNGYDGLHSPLSSASMEKVNIKRKPGASPLLFGKYLIDHCALIGLEDIVEAEFAGWACPNETLRRLCDFDRSNQRQSRDFSEASQLCDDHTNFNIRENRSGLNRVTHSHYCTVTGTVIDEV